MNLLHSLSETLETNFSKAHKIAQYNASLPIEQGGLGLHPENSAKDRARAMGYDVDKPMYRGLSQEHSDDVKKNITWVSPDPKHAEGYAYGVGSPNMMKVYIKSHNPVHLGYSKQAIHVPFKDIKNRVKERILDAFQKGNVDRDTAKHEFDRVDNLPDQEGFKYHWQWRDDNPEFKEALRNVGYDSVSDHEVGHDTTDTIGLFHPSQIKSVNAAFDPMKKEGIIEAYDAELLPDHFKKYDYRLHKDKIKNFNAIEDYILPKDTDLNRYASSGQYHNINGALWKAKFNPETSHHLITDNMKNIQNHIKSTKPATDEYSLYTGIRGIAHDASIVHIPSFISTSLTMDTAHQFANGKVGDDAVAHILKIQTRKGDHLGNMIKNAEIHEEEVLLPANSVLKIHKTNSYTDKNGYPIHVHTATIMNDKEIEANKDHPEVISHLRMKKELGI